MKPLQILISVILCPFLAAMLLLTSCTISYKFNGASIDYSKVKTISVADFTNNAALVYARQTADNPPQTQGYA